MSEDDNSPSGFVNDANLSAAIGRVAMQSALLDELLREILAWLYEKDFAVAIFLEGQKTDWLIQYSRAALNHVDHYYRTWPKDLHDEFNALLSRANELRVLRNIVVHGVWMHESVDDNPSPRPWGDIEDGTPVYSCYSSKYRRLFDERLFSVRDVENIAVKIADCCASLAGLCRKMHYSIPGNEVDSSKPWLDPLPRW